MFILVNYSPIKWRQRPDMTLAVDWDVKNQLVLLKQDGFNFLMVSQPKDLMSFLMWFYLQKIYEFRK